MDATIRPTKEAQAEARNHPNGWVYVIDGQFGADDAVPGDAIVGAWKVDAAGNIVGEMMKNPGYRPREKR